MRLSVITPGRPILAANVSVGVALVLIELLCLRLGLHASYLFDDPAEAANLPFYTGSLSIIGCALWGTSAGLAFTGWTLVRQLRDSDLPSALLSMGFLTAWVFVDDVLQIHERVFPKTLGIPEIVPVAVLYLVALGWAVRYRRIFVAIAPWPLVFAMIGFGIHALVDHVVGHRVPDIVKEGPKLLGIVNWVVIAAALTRAAVAALTDRAAAERGLSSEPSSSDDSIGPSHRRAG